MNCWDAAHDGFQSPWVMIREISAGGEGYMQSGYACVHDTYSHCCGEYGYAEWSKDGVHLELRMMNSDESDGTIRSASVEYRSEVLSWYLKWGSTIGLTVVKSEATLLKDRPDYFSVSHNGETMMPGWNYEKVTFTNLKCKRGAWYTPAVTCQGAGYASYRSDCPNGDSSFGVWDSR